MELDIIKKAGLTEAQAKVYLALLHEGGLTPNDIAEKSGEARTNVYAIVEKLTQMELVAKTNDKKAKYIALNPTGLELLAEKRRKILSQNEKTVKNNLSGLLDIFYANNASVGVRSAQGLSFIKEIYEDILRTGEDVYLLRTNINDDLVRDKIKPRYIHEQRELRAKKGIKTFALTLLTKTAKQNSTNGTDERLLFDRVMMPADAYQIPVEIQIYGRKVAIIHFGEALNGLIITDPMIAESMKWMILGLRDYWRKEYPQK